MTIRSTVFMLAAAVALLPFAPRDARAAAATTATATRPAADAWPRVPAVDWSKIKLDDFTDDELDLPYFLHHFHTVANAVIEAGSNRGFMSLGVWRGRDKNQQGTHNARVMESHLSLA